MKIAIIGSRRYENKKKIKDFIFKLKQQYGENTKVISGGCKDGADKYAKKYTLELEISYLKSKKGKGKLAFIFPSNFISPFPYLK